MEVENINEVATYDVDQLDALQRAVGLFVLAGAGGRMLG